jgi:hypothetical protein
LANTSKGEKSKEGSDFGDKEASVREVSSSLRLKVEELNEMYAQEEGRIKIPRNPLRMLSQYILCTGAKISWDTER